MSTGLLTMDQFQRALPKRCKNNVNEKIIDKVNEILLDPEMRETYRENLMSYTNVMADGKYKMESYLEAVRYVSHKLMGDTNTTAYIKTFPDRYQRLLNMGKNTQLISNHVTAYNKNRLVNLIMEQTLIPSHILNQDLYQKALNVQASMMVDMSASPKVRSDAADSLLTHLKAPESKKIELDINIKEDTSIADLRATTMELVAQQKKMIESGVAGVKAIAHSKLLIEDAEIVSEQ